MRLRLYIFQLRRIAILFLQRSLEIHLFSTAIDIPFQGTSPNMRFPHFGGQLANMQLENKMTEGQAVAAILSCQCHVMSFMLVVK